MAWFHTFKDLAVEFQKWNIRVCKTFDWSNGMGQRDWIQKVCCRSEVVLFCRGKVADKLWGSSFKKASDPKKIIRFKRRVFVQKEAAQQDKRVPAQRQVAWIFYDYFKVGDTDESVLDFTLRFWRSKWRMTTYSLSTAAGLWNHNRDEEATRRGNSPEWKSPSASTVKTAKTIAVSVNSKRHCSKNELRDCNRPKTMVVRC